eukprot:COSAG02_NODE_2146_length_9670_cov_7.714136_6_plen_63_part_00
MVLRPGLSGAAGRGDARSEAGARVALSLSLHCLMYTEKSSGEQVAAFARGERQNGVAGQIRN